MGKCFKDKKFSDIFSFKSVKYYFLFSLELDSVWSTTKLCNRRRFLVIIGLDERFECCGLRLENFQFQGENLKDLLVECEKKTDDKEKNGEENSDRSKNERKRIFICDEEVYRKFSDEEKKKYSYLVVNKFEDFEIEIFKNIFEFEGEIQVKK